VDGAPAVGDDLLAVEADLVALLGGRVRIAPRSEPAWGSVRSIAPISSPDAKPGR
jgi:hypothetical protein